MEAVHVNVTLQFAVQPRQQILCEGSGNTRGIVIGSL